ncbi:MAG: PTS sugar transporter subunit IIA [Actinobacteria bacterium]|jgi:PTS system mannitol-specific IIC component|nr:PTS sugar transporter subunit IIA [Actinomycetota bacterium]MBT7013889.1 PTS sugar transporter subunit IIA [Actinomycetota bacterium]MDA9608318.1 PTS sugar transporter subunit IIA [Candidatus Actinomarina sp.]MDG1228671.1 PTS sugar transporter subunit IIA [Candidatus Actinomarina sp.]|tara:strand:+ start:378 stop:821 length:444 start_codon:yes stop_codon:yes gene_type:complete
MNEHEVLLKESILTGQSFSSKEEATIMAGELLLENGYIEKEYIDSMLEKLDTQSFATYIGNGVAIPHGMADGSKFVRHTGISVIQVPEGIPWNEEVAYVIVGIAANSDDHMGVLSALADAIEDEEDAKKLWRESSAENIYNLLSVNL